MFERQKSKFKFFQTLYVNFRLLPISQALKLPIYIYGKTCVYSVSGSVVIEGEVTRGQVKLGYNSDLFVVDKASYLRIDGLLRIGGPVNFSTGYSLEVAGAAILEIGSCVGIGALVRIRAWNFIKIGEGSRIAVETQIYDTNFHYTLDIENSRINPRDRTVEVGSFCWIGNRVTVAPGTVLGDFTIVGSNSLCNRDYSKLVERYSLIAGLPAKLVKSNIVRIFDSSCEERISHEGSLSVATSRADEILNPDLHRIECFFRSL